MEFIMILLTLLLCVYCYKIDSCAYNPAAIYSLFWFCMMLLAWFQFYDIYEVSIEVYMLAFISVSFFVMGHVINLMLRSRFNITRKVKYDINIKMYYILLIVCIISLWQNYTLIGYVLSEGLSISSAYFLMARAVVGQSEELKEIYTDLGSQVQQYIGYPLLYLLIPTSILLYYKSFKNKYLVIVLLLFLIRFLADFKRTLLVFIILFFVFYAILMRKNISIAYQNNPLIGKKIKYFSIGLAIVLFAVFGVVSILRHNMPGDEYSLFQNFYYYYIGCFELLDIRISGWEGLNIDYTLGFTTFRGVIAPFIAIGKMIIGDEISTTFLDATYLVNSLHDYVVYISPYHLYNTYTTSLFQFYCDGGYIGVCVLSFLYGAFVSILYKDFCEVGDIRSVFRFGYIFCVFILFTNMHINSIVICYVWPLLLERLIYNRKYLN